MSLSTPPNWQALLESEFIVPIDCDASTLLASCKRVASQSITDSSDNTDQKTEAEILSFSHSSPRLKTKEAIEVLKHWNAQEKTIHHRSLNGQEKAIIRALKSYSPEELKIAIGRYGAVLLNREGKYRNGYPWTLSEFLSRQNGYNLERFNAENWEDPFIDQNKKEKSQDTSWLYTEDQIHGK